MGTFPSLTQVALGLVWLGAVIFLWHYLEGFRAHLSDLRQAREDFLEAARRRGDPPEEVRRALIGEVVAFGALFVLAVLAACGVTSGLAWFLMRVIGALRALLE